MAKKEELSKAELYRKERKERLAKEAKKNAKRNAKVAKIKRVTLKTVAVIVAVAIVASIAVAVVNATGSTFFKSTIAEVGNTKVSSAEVKYYYRTSHAQLVNQATQYDSYYGEGYYAGSQGFDYTKLPSEQTFPNEMLEGQGIDETFNTWDEYITYSTLDSIQYFNALAEEAEKNGVKLTEDEEKAITDQLEELRTTAAESGRTLNAYLKLSYGSGINENNVKNWMLRDTLAQKYAEQKQTEFYDSYKAEDLQKEFDDNKLDYVTADFRYYVFEVKTDDIKDGTAESEVKKAKEEAAKKAKKEAEEFLSKIKTEEQFITAAEALDKANADNDEESTTTNSAEATTLLENAQHAAFVSSFSEADADWAFSADRKVGDKKIFEMKTDGDVTNYYAMFVKSPAEKDSTVASDIKAYTFSYGTSADDAAKKETEAKAQKLVDEWNKLPEKEKTADEFAHLSHHVFPDEADTITSSDYEDYADGTLSTEVDTWANDAKRKPGDVALVKSGTACYVVYYTQKNTEANWQLSARSTLSAEAFEEFIDTLRDKPEYALSREGKLKQFGLRNLKKTLGKDLESYLFALLQNQEQSASNSYTAG